MNPQTHDLPSGRELRDAGLALIEQARREWIEEARDKAERIARRRGTVTISDVRDVMTLPEGWHPNTWGAVLKCGRFAPVGFSQARHPAAHARAIRIYQLNEEQAL